TITVPFSCPRTVTANSDRVRLKKRAARATGREDSTPFQTEVAATEGSSQGGSNREAHRFGVSFTAVSNASSRICVKSPLLSLLWAPRAAYGLAGLVEFSCVSNQIIFLPLSSQELRWDTPKPFHCGSSLTGCSQPRTSMSYPCRTAGKTNGRK